MTTETTLETRVVIPNSPDSINAFAERAEEQRKIHERAEQALDQAEGILSEADIRTIRDALANGEIAPSPMIVGEPEEPGEEV